MDTRKITFTIDVPLNQDQFADCLRMSRQAKTGIKLAYANWRSKKGAEKMGQVWRQNLDRFMHLPDQDGPQPTAPEL